MKTVFITGVSSGLGQGLAEYYLENSWRVLGCSRRKPSALVDRDSFQFAQCDLSEFEQIPEAFDSLFSERKQCDLVILNAGVLSPFGDMSSVTIEESQKVLDVNLWANKAVLDWLFNSEIEIGQVVAISSGAAVNGNRGWNAYSISKAALNMLVKLYAAEHPEIHFSSFAPGLIETAMQETLCVLPQDNRFPTLDSLKARRNTAQMPTPQELAPRLANAFEEVPEKIESGLFIDIRKLPW